MKIHSSFVRNIGISKNGAILVFRLKYIHNLKAFSMFTFLQENLNTMTISLIGKTNIKNRIIIVSSSFLSWLLFNILDHFQHETVCMTRNDPEKPKVLCNKNTEAGIFFKTNLSISIT